MKPDESEKGNYSSILPQKLRLPKDTMTIQEVKNNSRYKVSPIWMSKRRLPHEKVELLIGTWSLRTLNVIGKLENLRKEMDKLRMDVLGIEEVKWPEGK